MRFHTMESFEKNKKTKDQGTEDEQMKTDRQTNKQTSNGTI